MIILLYIYIRELHLSEGSDIRKNTPTPHPDEQSEDGSLGILRHFVPQDEPPVSPSTLLRMVQRW